MFPMLFYLKGITQEVEIVKTSLVLTAGFLLLSCVYAMNPNRHYTEAEFHRDIGIEAVYSTSDIIRLMSYEKEHQGDFYDYSLQGSFLYAVRQQKNRFLIELPQCKIIQELYDRKTSKQGFHETMAGVQELLKREDNNYSPSVIAYCLLSEVMPHKKELDNTDITFFLDVYRKTDNKILQHAIYTAILNGENAIKHKDVILESGTWLDVYYLYLSLIATTSGEEQEEWKKQLQRLKMKSPILGKWIDSSLEDFRKSKRR